MILVVYVLIALAQNAGFFHRLSLATISGIGVVFVSMALLPTQRSQALASAGSVVLISALAVARTQRSPPISCRSG